MPEKGERQKSSRRGGVVISKGDQVCLENSRSPPISPALASPTLGFTQTHIHQVGDAIQPSHPLSSPSPPATDPSQHQQPQRRKPTRLPHPWDSPGDMKHLIEPSKQPFAVAQNRSRSTPQPRCLRCGGRGHHPQEVDGRSRGKPCVCREWSSVGGLLGSVCVCVFVCEIGRAHV